MKEKNRGNFGSLNFHVHWAAEVMICIEEDPNKTILVVPPAVSGLKQVSSAAAALNDLSMHLYFALEKEVLSSS